jgi:hypothetical protein
MSSFPASLLSAGSSSCQAGRLTTGLVGKDRLNRTTVIGTEGQLKLKDRLNRTTVVIGSER